MTMWRLAGTDTVVTCDAKPDANWEEVMLISVDDYPAPAEPDPLTTLETVEDVETFLLGTGLQAPEYNPWVNSRDHMKRWAGSNRVIAVGVDADGKNVAAEIHRYPGGSDHLSITKATANSSSPTGSWAVTFPIRLLAPQAIVNHPQWTPGHGVSEIDAALHDLRVERERLAPAEDVEAAWEQAHDLYDIVVGVLDCLTTTDRQYATKTAEDRIAWALRVADAKAAKVGRR